MRAESIFQVNIFAQQVNFIVPTRLVCNIIVKIPLSLY